MTVALSTDSAKTGWLKVHIVGDANAAGLLGEVYNPEGVLLQITRGFLYIETPSTAAAVPLVGIGATGVSANDILATLATNQVAGTVWLVVGMDRASEAAATTPWGVLWPATSYLTVTNSVAASAALVADLYLQYIRLA
jgi:hypothetical protein